MPYNPGYNKQTWSSEEQISSTKLNQMVDNTDHNYKYKAELGPDAPTNPIIREAIGQVTITLNSESTKEVVVTFATDSDHGNPGFSSEPRIFLTLKSTFVLINAVVKTASATSFIIKVATTDGNIINATLYVNWRAIGN